MNTYTDRAIPSARCVNLVLDVPKERIVIKLLLWKWFNFSFQILMTNVALAAQYLVSQPLLNSLNGFGLPVNDSMVTGIAEFNGATDKYH